MAVKLKICGMSEPENILQVLRYRPDYLGFIFYEKSPRYAGNDLERIREVAIPVQVRKVGVFVNEEIEKILYIREVLSLDVVQLHGNEPVQFCESLRSKGMKVMKVFSIGPDFEFKVMEPYTPYVDYFLFDTKVEYYGGSGRSFDWKVIDLYPFKKPFFLGGGVGSENIREVRQFKNPHLYAVDINSRVESAPGVKDLAKLRSFRQQFDKIN